MLLVKKKEHNVYLYALIAAILMHLLILLIPLLLSFFKLLLLAVFPNSQLFAADKAPPQPQTEPIVLEFKKPEALPNKFYELYENPNANEQAPQQSDILSDKSSISVAPNPEAPPSPVPKAKLPNAVAEEKSKELPQEVKDLNGRENIFAYNNQRKFSKNLLTRGEQDADDPSEEKQQATTDVVSEDFDAKLVGDFALSTYEWEWAPYWLDFKKKLYRVWTTPPAYFKLGLIYGYTIIWVKLNRAGEMIDHKVLKHEGHNSLLESSVGAIRSSFPFKPLPADFPDEYLEITFMLSYPNLRELSAQ